MEPLKRPKHLCSTATPGLRLDSIDCSFQHGHAHRSPPDVRGRGPIDFQHAQEAWAARKHSARPGLPVSVLTMPGSVTIDTFDNR